MDNRREIRKFLLPAALVLFAAAQSFGIDAGRALSRVSFSPDSLAVSDSTAPAMDSLTDALDSIAIVPNPDTLSAVTEGLADSTGASGTVSDSTSGEGFDDDFGDFLEAEEDSVPQISVLDTLTIPEGLDTLDPFKFKYFKAIKDSATLVMTRDSLLAIPDSVELFRLDSLYTKDSSEVAAWKFAQWYASLDKDGLKKYHFQKKMEAKMHRMDSVLNLKEEKMARRDSIRTDTPRILETYVLPDSMLYKRIVTWTHDSDFNNVETFDLDTSYNFHFNDYPFYRNDVKATYLGVAGSAAQTYNWFKREHTEGAGFYDPYTVYSYNKENLPQYNTKTPYTELAYWGNLFTTKQKAEDDIKILTTQNITPATNVTLEYHRYGGGGWLQHEKTDNRTFVFSGNHIGKKYVMHAGYIFNSVKRNENGGIVDNKWIRDTLVDPKEIETRLASAEASNKLKKNTIFLDQTYRIPFSFINNIKTKKLMDAQLYVRDSLALTLDSAALANYDSTTFVKIKDSLATNNSDLTSAFIGTSSEYSVYVKSYKDALRSSDKTGSELYGGNFFLNPAKTADSLRFLNIDNKIFLKLQPWSRDAIVSNVNAGVGDRIRNWYSFQPGSYLKPANNVIKNSLYAYAGAGGQFKDYLTWNAKGWYGFAGYEMNDMSLEADAELRFKPFRRDRNSPMIFGARFETSLREPDWYQQHLYANHARWDNEFTKTSVTRIEGHFSIPRWKLDAEVGYALLANNIYYDSLSVIRQNATPMSVLSASLHKDFALSIFHFDHNILFQMSSNEEVLPLPMLAARLRYYIQFNVKKNVMQMQLGANATMSTRWYEQGYNPALGVFYNQRTEQYGMCPYIDVFANVQWKRCCIYVRYVNLNMGWPSARADFFSAHNYIMPERCLRLGIFWPFYTLSESAVSSKGGAAGGRGASGGRGAAGRMR
ncbi:MAG: putative porin [Bacteroidales bacterium]|nr:putative porin [Bacteroidales bacterium]